MKISIITATYNSAATIKDTLLSVCEQTYSNIEHIVVDGGSTDDTIEIVKSFASVSSWISEPDKGIYDALNKGVQMATGDVIGFVHSDDTLATSTIIEKIVDVFSNEDNIEKVSGVFGNLVFTNNENEVVRTWISKPFTRNNIKKGWMPPHPTLFLRKEIYQKYGLFDISFKIAGDYDFMLRVMNDKDARLVLLPEVITRMRVGGVSTGNLKQLLNKSKEDIRALRNNGSNFPLNVLFWKIALKVPQLFNSKNIEL